MELLSNRSITEGTACRQRLARSIGCAVHSPLATSPCGSRSRWPLSRRARRPARPAERTAPPLADGRRHAGLRSARRRAQQRDRARRRAAPRPALTRGSRSPGRRRPTFSLSDPARAGALTRPIAVASRCRPLSRESRILEATGWYRTSRSSSRAPVSECSGQRPCEVLSQRYRTSSYPVAKLPRRSLIGARGRCSMPSLKRPTRCLLGVSGSCSLPSLKRPTCCCPTAPCVLLFMSSSFGEPAVHLRDLTIASQSDLSAPPP